MSSGSRREPVSKRYTPAHTPFSPDFRLEKRGQTGTTSSKVRVNVNWVNGTVVLNILVPDWRAPLPRIRRERFPRECKELWRTAAAKKTAGMTLDSRNAEEEDSIDLILLQNAVNHEGLFVQYRRAGD